MGVDRVIAEGNQGGEMVESVLRSVDALLPIRRVHASVGKSARAEPVAALYEQGRVTHLPGLGPLEDRLCQMSRTGYQGKGSPDRADALVWALTELIIEPAKDWRDPHIRALFCVPVAAQSRSQGQSDE